MGAALTFLLQCSWALSGGRENEKHILLVYFCLYKGIIFAR